MNVEIITIGDEILIGQIVDTNSAWIAKELNKNGFSVKRILSISDSAEQIKRTVADAFSEADAVIVTGGLGPTNDDITKQTLCEFFGTKLVFSQEQFDRLQKYLAVQNLEMNELNRLQALVPESAKIIENEVGTAPNMCFEQNGKILFSLPGVPSEMQAVMPKVIAMLKEKFGEKTHLQRHFLVYGIPESTLAVKLQKWESALPESFHLAYLPAFGQVRLRLSVETCTNETLAKMDEVAGELRSILGHAILAEDDVPLEVLVGRMLKAQNKALATAESCTGGNIARKITSVPGSSAYFKGGVVAYTNEVKEEVLNVSSFDIDSYGVVSVPIVEQMAQGVLELMDVDVAVATSGVAGPATDNDEKAVGTVCIAVATRESVKAQQFVFGKMRERNIECATIAALVMIKEALS